MNLNQIIDEIVMYEIDPAKPNSINFKQLSSILDVMSAGVAYYDAQGKLLFFNKALVDIIKILRNIFILEIHLRTSSLPD